METIETLKAKEIKIREKIQQEKKGKFQERLAKTLIYYCSDGGKDYLPTDEKLFLTAIVCGLMDIFGIEDMEISPFLFSQDWRDDIEEILIAMKETIESKDFKELFHGCYSLGFSMKEIVNLEYHDNPLTGVVEHKAYLMTIFENIRDISGYSGRTFKISPKVTERIEKNIIPNLTPNFANLAPNLSVIYFVKILAEKAKKHLKKDTEEKSYIDRE